MVFLADSEFAHAKNMVVMSGGCWWVGGGGADAAEYLFPQEKFLHWHGDPQRYLAHLLQGVRPCARASRSVMPKSA